MKVVVDEGSPVLRRWPRQLAPGFPLPRPILSRYTLEHYSVLRGKRLDRVGRVGRPHFFFLLTRGFACSQRHIVSTLRASKRRLRFRCWLFLSALRRLSARPLRPVLPHAVNRESSRKPPGTELAASRWKRKRLRVAKAPAWRPSRLATKESISSGGASNYATVSSALPSGILPLSRPWSDRSATKSLFLYPEPLLVPRLRARPCRV